MALKQYTKSIHKTYRYISYIHLQPILFGKRYQTRIIINHNYTLY